MNKNNKTEVIKVKSRTRKKKSSPKITLNKKKSVKKSVSNDKKIIFKIEGLDNTLLKKYGYSPNNSESKRKQSLGNAVIVYDPKGLYEALQKILSLNKTNKTITDILKKDSEFVKKNYYKFIL